MFLLLMTLACFGDKDAKTETKTPAKTEKTEKAVKAEKPAAQPKFQPDAPAAESGTTPEEKAALTKAEAGLTSVKDAVRTQLGEATKGDLVAAIPVCGDAAKGAIDAAAKDGVTVGRSSTKLRNPQNAAPDWVSTWLAAQPADSTATAAKGFARIDTTDKGKVARVLKPLAVEATCLRCHTSPEHLKPEVLAAIQAKYPADAATGYKLGDLRGAIYAETPL